MNLYLVDANIIIYLANVDSPYFEEAQHAVDELKRQGNGLCVAPQIAIEFWNTATSHKKTGLGWSARSAYKSLIVYKSAFSWLEEPSTLFDNWFSLCVTLGIVGATCYDARIVALMNHYEITNILTKNIKHFTSFPGINAIDPATI